MTAPELEKLYEALAEQLDVVPADKREMFLAKLVLLLAHDSGNLQSSLSMIDAAALNLEI